MKKLIASIGLASAVFIGGLSSVNAAAYVTSGAPAILVASVTVSGVVAATINSALIKDYNVPASATRSELNWPAVNINTGWQRAAQMIMLNYNVTVDNGGIEIFTDNTKGAGTPTDPRFEDPTITIPTNSDSGAGGLLKTGANTTNRTIPLAWKVATDTVSVTTGDPNTTFDWFYIADATNTAGIDWNNDGFIGAVPPATTGHEEELGMSHGGFYASPIFGRGAQMFQAQPVAEDQDGISFIYLAINTGKASANNTYRTSKLNLQAYFN